MTAPVPKAIFFGDEVRIKRTYAQGRWEAIAERAHVFPKVITTDNLAQYAPELVNVEVMFSTWGMPLLSAAQLDLLPSLRALFYAAGTVQPFARPLLERGITVVSGWAANAVPVAEFTVSQILLANKGYFQNTRKYVTTDKHMAMHQAGNFGETIALIGAGMVARKVIEFLKPYHLKVVVYDPFLPDSEANALGVEKVTLDAAFARAGVVSNHLPDLPDTLGMFTGAHFASMRPHATFINTGRGATIREDEMIRVLTDRPDITALLDVTAPEPPLPHSPLRTLPNVFLSSHIAGSAGDEVLRIADYAIEEFDRWRAGEPLRYAITLDMLDRVA
ncbi:2-hydroxyacid dehydrogenase [Capsulimonas corticalis]|uniref:2-hydroxyacid dehydrogenase n=1 Tax=Capsulimonas corticalis TaxID=2219043 RepID=A0A402CP63_9BACT|nr:hydroxyacid dehydrogenase [Capsulimonas corticalis]BDI33183.1 2-hydroxyacid dehydrogenase [Capsulimonas corticalis]